MNSIQKSICLDFGNTSLKVAYFENNQFIEQCTVQDTIESMEEIIKKYKPSKSILSSVINHNIEIEEVLKSKTRFHKLSHNSKLNFTTPIGSPANIGADRIALVEAGIALFPNKHLLIICLGTCITYNFVNIFSEFLGGGISPGLGIRLKSLNDFTALLPLVKPTHEFPLIGYDTKTNILSGVILGIEHELNGIIKNYLDKFAKINVILTGGDMLFFENRIKYKIFADQHLIFKGLNSINEKNN